MAFTLPACFNIIGFFLSTQSLSPLSEGLEHERVQLLNRIDGDIKDLNKEEATEITEAANDILEGEEQEALREYEETPDEAIEPEEEYLDNGEGKLTEEELELLELDDTIEEITEELEEEDVYEREPVIPLRFAW